MTLSSSLRSSIPLLCAGLLALLAGPVSAQTPAATIEDDGGTVVLESYVDGALLAPGTFGTGTIPTTGPGTRLMWHPAKAAFRVGNINGDQWDPTNVGDYSMAFGVNTVASGISATAMGDNTTASGNVATAMGGSTTAATDLSLTIGGYNKANTSADNSLFVVGNGSSGSRSDALVLKKSGILSVDSAFVPGPTNSTYAGHFRKSRDGSDSNPKDHVALIENTSSGSAPSSSVLALRTGEGSPDGNDNFITFFASGDTPVGRVEGDGGGGINLVSGGADFAEELPVAAGADAPEQTDLVGVTNGQVSLQTGDVDRVMVVSQSPIMTGNATTEATADDDRRVPVAFIGQVPVRLRGPAEVGDLIVASGQNDGTARAVAPEAYRPSKHGPIAGETWEAKTTDGVGKITVAVGLDQSGVLARQVERQRATIDSLKERVQKVEDVQARLAELEAEVQDRSVWAGMPGSGVGLGLLLGGLLGAGLLWRRRE